MGRPVIVLLMVLVGIGFAAWAVAGLPPLQYVVRYGLDPRCAPTGRSVVIEGVEFVEIGPGVVGMAGIGCQECESRPEKEWHGQWVEFPRGVWITPRDVTRRQYERYDAVHRWMEPQVGPDDVIGSYPWFAENGYREWLSERAARPLRKPTLVERGLRPEVEWRDRCGMTLVLELPDG